MVNQLKLSDNSKTKFKKNHYNTFGLPHGRPKDGGTCPGSTCGTGGCLDTRQGKRQTCYVAKIVQIYKATGKVLSDNYSLLENKSTEEMTEIIRSTICQFVKKTPIDKLFFRLHWAGDFFSKEYAVAWSTVIREFPDVRFWAYTRSPLEIINPLFGINNLTLFLSCDPVNFEEINKLYQSIKNKYNNLALAHMGDTAPELIDNERFVVCPEISGKVKNTAERGGCAACRLCINNYKIKPRNIQFPIH